MTDHTNKTNPNSGINKQSDQDIERAVEAQAEGQQPKGVEAESQTSQDSELDTRESKFKGRP